LELGPDHEVLYADPPDPDAAIWTGREPDLSELADSLGIEVRPIDDYQPATLLAAVAPVDALTTLWLNDVAGLDLEPAFGEPQSQLAERLADVLVALRLRHDDAAVAQIRQAVAVTHDAHVAGMRATRSAQREAGVRAAMVAEVERHGMNMAYQPIVTVHGEVLHNESSSGLIENHDLLLADVGAETPTGWAADVTRTWPARARFAPAQRDLYQVVVL
jgi:Xaa-Pro aminopeptidase